MNVRAEGRNGAAPTANPPRPLTVMNRGRYSSPSGSRLARGSRRSGSLGRASIRRIAFPPLFLLARAGSLADSVTAADRVVRRSDVPGRRGGARSKAARRKVRRMIAIWLASTVAAFLLAAFLIVLVALVIAATIRACH